VSARSAIAPREVQRFGAASAELGAPETDDVAVEEPLELRIAGEPIAITMRTPGDDVRLALGLLFAEGVIASIDDVGTIAHCGRPGDEGYGNVIDVAPGAGVSLDTERLAGARRGTLTVAACGVCGRRSIDDLLARCEALGPGPRVSGAIVASSVERLRETQVAFARTGGLHGAAALSAAGDVLASAEDVGRHNAVDKVVGALFEKKAIGGAAVLVVSGRTSFEIVQKAVVARIPIVAAVSAPSSLAVDLAKGTNLTLVGFVRDGALSVYAHPERIG